jgi:DtxR family Mn-dependent transcriptional regulator
MRQSKSVEDFLEALLMLEEKKEPLETTKVAEILQVSKPAVHQMGHELIAKGYITREDYGDMTLTPTGRKLATEVYHRHKVLKTYLLEIGVSEANAENDCCQIEHVISQETFRAIEKLTKK